MFLKNNPVEKEGKTGLSRDWGEKKAQKPLISPRLWICTNSSHSLSFLYFFSWTQWFTAENWLREGVNSGWYWSLTVVDSFFTAGCQNQTAAEQWSSVLHRKTLKSIG